MERLTFTDRFVDIIKFDDEGPVDIQDLITALIDLKREKRKEGWSNLKAGKSLIDKEYAGVVCVYGDRRESDAEFERRKKLVAEYEKMETKDLLEELDTVRRRENYWETTEGYAIRHVLAGREHVPSSSENKAIRKIQARTGIKDIDELREKHGDERIALMAAPRNGKA